jgi:hypothetical protein
MRKNNKNRKKEPVKNIGKGVSEYIAFFHKPNGEDLILNIPTKDGILSKSSQMSWRRGDDGQWDYFRYTELPRLIQIANQQTAGRFYVWVAKLDHPKELIEYYSGKRGWLTPDEYLLLKAEREAILNKVVKLKWQISTVSRFHHDKVLYGYTETHKNLEAAIKAAYEEVKNIQRTPSHMNKFIVYLADKPCAECVKVGWSSIDRFDFKYS